MPPAILGLSESLLAFGLRFPLFKESAPMETATSIPVRSASLRRKIDWPFLAFWLGYFSTILAVVHYVVF
jgi:hypothetical protein